MALHEKRRQNVKSRLLPLMPFFLSAPGAPSVPRRTVPHTPSARVVRVSFNGEDLHAVHLIVDARDSSEREEDLRAGTLKGPVAVFFQGHAQRPTDAYGFTSALARLSSSGIVVVPVCDTPFGTDGAWRGDDGKTPVLMEVARSALVPLGIRVGDCPAPAGGPVLIDGTSVDDRACPVAAGLMVLGWSHGGILARRLAHAYPGCISALGQVCPAGYEQLTPVGLTALFAREALRISKIATGRYRMDALRSAMGFTRGFTGDIARSLASAAVSLYPARSLRAVRDVLDCSLYCDSSAFGLEHIRKIAVAFGENDTCMSPRRILGAHGPAGLTGEAAASFWQRYYADVPRDLDALCLNILPGTHLAPVTHSDLYARTILGNLGELAPGA